MIIINSSVNICLLFPGGHRILISGKCMETCYHCFMKVCKFYWKFQGKGGTWRWGWTAWSFEWQDGLLMFLPIRMTVLMPEFLHTLFLSPYVPGSDNLLRLPVLLFDKEKPWDCSGEPCGFLQKDAWAAMQQCAVVRNIVCWSHGKSKPVAFLFIGAIHTD